MQWFQWQTWAFGTAQKEGKWVISCVEWVIPLMTAGDVTTIGKTTLSTDFKMVFLIQVLWHKWMMRGLLSFTFGLVEYLLKYVGVSTFVYNVTSKMVEEEQKGMWKWGMSLEEWAEDERKKENLKKWGRKRKENKIKKKKRGERGMGLRRGIWAKFEKSRYFAKIWEKYQIWRWLKRIGWAKNRKNRWYFGEKIGSRVPEDSAEKKTQFKKKTYLSF